MDCSVAEGMVNRYINRTLDERELDAFLKHIENCSSCYDELETYFIVHEATKQLDEQDSDSTLDIKGLLKQDIHRSRMERKRHKILHAIGKFLLCAGAAVFLFCMVRLLLYMCIGA
jgi:effector-binding domain-containing protein